MKKERWGAEKEREDEERKVEEREEEEREEGERKEEEVMKRKASQLIPNIEERAAVLFH